MKALKPYFKIGSLFHFSLLFLFLPKFAFNQIISLEKYNLNVETHFKGKERNYVDSLFHDTTTTIIIIKLLPDCDEKGNCYPESIIRENFNREQQLADSVDVFDSYFAGVKKYLIDFSSAVKVDSADYPFFLLQLLHPEISTDNQASLICYEPRHAVLFLNAKKEIVAVHEICFECGKTIVSIYANRLHDQTAKPFKSVFQKYGLLE